MKRTARPNEVERVLTLAKSGAALPTVEIGPEPGGAMMWPIVFIVGGLQSIQDLFDVTRPAHVVPWIFLVFYCCGFIVFLFARRARLRVTGLGVEIDSGFRRQAFRYADIYGSFELFQRKIMPGFDIIFRVREAAVSEADGLGKPVRIGGFDIADSVLLELLRTYKERSLVGSTMTA